MALVVKAVIAPVIAVVPALLLAGPARAQVPQTGPVIEDFGPVYEVPGSRLGPPPLGVMRAVFDVVDAPDDPGVANPRIASVARYLNMHARAGLPADRMRVALVLHGGAGRYALNDEAYWDRFDAENPDSRLLDELSEAGVAIYLCGQTAGFRDYAEDELHASVQLALSAMTALVRLQDEGYRLIMP
jgi:intracellular sulfur oxidation DsrE/DsrF family protein